MVISPEVQRPCFIRLMAPKLTKRRQTNSDKILGKMMRAAPLGHIFALEGSVFGTDGESVRHIAEWLSEPLSGEEAIADEQ